VTPWVRRAAAAAAPLCAVLTMASACGSTPDTATPAARTTSISTSVDVATPELQALKASAGIADCPQVAPVDPVPEGLPDLTLPCLGGGADVALSSLRGKPLVLNLWASWCGPCRDELPLFQRVHEAFGSRLTVLGVDINDQQPAKALALASDTGVTYPLLADPDASLRVPLEVMGLLQTVLVAADGRMVSVERRVFSSYDQLRSLVLDRLGVAG